MKSKRDKAIYFPFLIQHDSFQKSSSLNNLPVLLGGWLHFVFSPLELPSPKITHIQGTHLSLVAGALSLASQKFPVQRGRELIWAKHMLLNAWKHPATCTGPMCVVVVLAHPHGPSHLPRVSMLVEMGGREAAPIWASQCPHSITWLC